MLISLFKNEYQDINLLKSIITGGTQLIIEAPNVELNEYFTPGANIDEILCDFLTQNSKKFSKFSILETQSNSMDIHKVDYKIVAYDDQQNKKLLEAKFYIYDAHNKENKLNNLIHKTQTYKLLQEVLSLKIHEEIFEVQRKGGNKPQITRYCVLYEYENKEYHNQRSLLELMSIWDQQQTATDNNEQFSLEKVAFYMLQMLQTIMILQGLRIFSYLDLNLQSFVVNQKQELLIRSPLTDSFKLIGIKHKQEEYTLQINLSKSDPNQFHFKYLVKDHLLAEYNTRLQVALIFQQILDKFSSILELPFHYLSQESSTQQTTALDSFREMKAAEKESTKKFQQVQYQKKLVLLVENIIKTLRDPNNVEIDYFQLIENNCKELYLLKSFRFLCDQLFKEKQYLACIFAFTKLQQQFPTLMGEDMNFNNKFYLLLIYGKSLIKVGNVDEGTKILEEAYQYLQSLLDNTDNEEGVLVLYEFAKANRKLRQIDKCLELISQCYQINQRMHGEYNIQATKCMNLQYKCYMDKKDYERALKYLESKFQMESKIFNGIYSKQMAKTQFKIGLLHKQMGKNAQALYFVEKAYFVFSKVYGEIDPKSQEVLIELSKLQIQAGDFTNGLKNFQFLLTQHMINFSFNHKTVLSDHKFIGLCLLNLQDYQQAQYHFKQCIQIAQNIFVIIQDKDQQESVRSARLLDKDSVFESLQDEQSQFSFVNYNLGYALFKLQNYDQADLHFQMALKYILKLDKSLQQEQKEFIAEIHHYFGINCIQLKKLDKARINLEYALEYYESCDILDGQKHAYDCTKEIYQHIIKIKREQNHLIAATESAKSYTNYVKLIIILFAKNKNKAKELLDAEMDLVKAYNILLELYAMNNSDENLKLIQDIYIDQLRILERDLRSNKGEYIKVCMKLSHHLQQIDDHKAALKFLQKAKDAYEKHKGVGDQQLLFDILLNLAHLHYLAENKKESYDHYKQILLHQNDQFQDFILAFSLYEKIFFNQNVADLCETFNNLKDAIIRYEIVYELLQNKDLNDKDLKDQYEIPTLNALCFCLNKMGVYERALHYASILHELNIKNFGDKHPNTMNSCLTQMKLLNKVRFVQNEELTAKKKLLKTQIVDIIITSCKCYKDKFDFKKEYKDEEFNLFKNYLLDEQTIKFLNYEFQKDKDHSLNFLRNQNDQDNQNQIEKLLEFFLNVQEKSNPQVIQIKKMAKVIQKLPKKKNKENIPLLNL